MDGDHDRLAEPCWCAGRWLSAIDQGDAWAAPGDLVWVCAGTCPVSPGHPAWQRAVRAARGTA